MSFAEILDGYKNYIFGGMLIIAGIANYFLPADMDITLLGTAEPGTLISLGLGWILGRNAIKKVEVQP